MGFGGGNMQKMLKQVQKMQADMVKIQEKLAEMTVEGTAGGGVVKIIMNGKQEVMDISLEPEILDPEDSELIEDLLMAAFNEALRKVQDLAEEQMGKATGGLNIPGLF
ncbi:MAG TPA: YbaB/EbfC family nucleoid-associated protein [Clostridia bacterium]|jgi:DNA-binding YbaB/EbfC family protein|nr:YbaB/EbfC family nucleoid-associated protein [Clostridia bacterium]